MRGTQASVNPKAETVEELLGRRKNLHLGMMKLAQEDLALQLHAAHDASVVTCPPPLHLVPSISCASAATKPPWY